jgi:hypothetical protein
MIRIEAASIVGLFTKTEFDGKIEQDTGFNVGRGKAALPLLLNWFSMLVPRIPESRGLLHLAKKVCSPKHLQFP